MKPNDIQEIDQEKEARITLMAMKIFFCYAHEDEFYLNKLKAYLRPLQRQGLIDVWYDRDISAGTKWEQEINERLNEAQIILLLVSPDFMNSDYCYSVEMKRALERHDRKEARVIPVILRPIYWQGVLGTIQALPTDAKPVVDRYWHTLDEALYDVAEGIRKVVMQLVSRPVFASPTAISETQREVAKSGGSTPPVQQGGKLSPFIAPLDIKKLRLLRTLTGHTNVVGCVAINSDGQTLVSGSWDNTLKMWDLSTGQEVCTLRGHTDSVWSVAISPDGQTLVSGGRDGKIKVWDLSTGQEVRTLTSSVTCVAISPDGQTLVSGNSDLAIMVLWDLSTGQEVRRIRTLTGSVVWSIAISPEGQTLVSGCHDGKIKVWDFSTGQEVRTLTGHRRGAACVAISPDDQTLVSQSEDNEIKVWDLSTGQEVRTLTGHRRGVGLGGSGVAISLDGQTLVSGGSDNEIKLWNLTSGQEVRTLTGHRGAVNCVVFSPDGQTLVSGGSDNEIKLWGEK